jgi:hypothetical protein
LAKYGIYATEGVKYKQLEMKAASPIALVLVTSGEIKRTARLIASKAGIYLVTSSDLCAIFSAQWKATGMQPPATVQALTDTLRTEIGSVQVTG